MTNLARLIAKNQQTCAPVLDLGNCQLTGDEPELLLLPSLSHVEKLIFCDEYWRSEGDGARVKHKSKNKGAKNELQHLRFGLPPNLKSLFLAGALDLGKKPQKSLAQIEQLQHLEELDVFGCKLKTLDFLAPLSQLQSLTITDNPLRGLQSLENLKNLKILISNSSNIKNLSPLASLQNLQILMFWNNNLNDISPLSGLSELNELILGCNNIKDISTLATMPKLTHLQLWENDNISDISPIAELTAMRDLNLASNKINNINALSDMHQLQQLHIDRNPIDNIAVLENMPKLHYLVVDLPKLHHLPSYGILCVARYNKPTNDFSGYPTLGDFEQKRNLPELDKIWQLLISSDKDNITLAKQLTKGLLWSPADFELYCDAARQLKNLE
jgi:Leucine-rich repeat (LRR) protein